MPTAEAALRRLNNRLTVVAAVVLTIAACGASPEPALLDQFFTASRLRDRTALARIAATPFDPAQHGTVQSFEVLSVAVLKPDLKEVHVRARIRPPAGDPLDKPLSILLQKVDGRWRVAGFSDVTDTPLNPPTRPN